MIAVRLIFAVLLSLGLVGGVHTSFAQKPGQKEQKAGSGEKLSSEKPVGEKPTSDKSGSDKRPEKKPDKNTERPTPKPSSEKPFPEKVVDKTRLIAITPEREAAVTTFVERNHPELAELLAHLKDNHPKEYERAVRDLFRVTEKLAMVRERDDQQYDLELKVWKAQSRAQLLVARLKMADPESGDSEELKKQLREVLSDQMQSRLQVMKLERERVTGRLDKLNAEISKLEKDREAVIEMHLKNLTNQVNANRPKAKNPDNKPAKKP